MDKADCLPCRIGNAHTFHDDGSVNEGYDYEGAQPPSQESSHCSLDGSCASHPWGERRDCQAPSFDTWSQEEMEAFARGLIDTKSLDPDHKPPDLVYQAIDLVYGDRQGAYGHPYDDYSRTAGMWSAFLGVEITPAQAALMMVLLKVSRERNRPKDDNIVDAHGYLLCYGRIQGREDAA